MNETDSSDPSSAIAALQAAQRHHVSMTAMADQKASLLLAASLLVLGLLLPSGFRHLSVMVLGATAVGTAVCAILALTPRMVVLRDPKSGSEVNLLFCGHFANFSEEDYVARLRTALLSPSDVVDALARDLFQMGLLVHQKKFRFLGFAYTVCLFGLGATVLGAVLDAMA